MAILSGYKRFKDYLLTSTGYILTSRRTTSDAVVIGNGLDDNNTLEKKLNQIDNALANHRHAASSIASGTLAGKVLANASAVESNDAQLRNIQASTTDLTAGETPLATGEIYVVYQDE